MDSGTAGFMRVSYCPSDDFPDCALIEPTYGKQAKKAAVRRPPSGVVVWTETRVCDYASHEIQFTKPLAKTGLWPEATTWLRPLAFAVYRA